MECIMHIDLPSMRMSCLLHEPQDNIVKHAARHKGRSHANLAPSYYAPPTGILDQFPSQQTSCPRQPPKPCLLQHKSK